MHPRHHVCSLVAAHEQLIEIQVVTGYAPARATAIEWNSALFSFSRFLISISSSSPLAGVTDMACRGVDRGMLSRVEMYDAVKCGPVR